VRLIRYPHAPFRARVWELRDNLSAYDALYLALAEALEGAILVTSDSGLAANAAHVLGDPSRPSPSVDGARPDDRFRVQHAANVSIASATTRS
jgi:hypothetical protein